MSIAAESINQKESLSGGERDYWSQLLANVLSDRKTPLANEPKASRLTLLSHMFGLNEFEKKLVATLWVCAYSPELRNHLMTFDPVVPVLSPLLVARVFQLDPVYRLSTESPLVIWEMIREQELVDGSVTLAIDPHIVSWLEGNNDLDHWLVSRVNLLTPSFQLKSWSLNRYKKKISAHLKKNQSCRIYLDTDDELLAQAFATELAQQLGIVVAKYDIDNLSPELSYRFSMRVQRQSFLDRCAPMFFQNQQALSQPNGIAVFPLQFVVGTPQAWNLKQDIKDVVIEIPELTNQDRKVIWQYALPNITKWPKKHVDDLIWRSHHNATEIIRIGAKQPKQLKQVTEYIRSTRHNDLDGLAQPVNSQFNWQDLVVPKDLEDRLQEVVFEARERNRIWSDPEARRLFPHGRGLVALFSGPPGSGKTMAAQVIANELGLDLLRIDLSAVVSKWVGETTQNLQKILSAKISQQSVLFFDEADSIYGKRVNDIKDANDRYVNMDSGHLMVALENFDGIVLMATNLKANIDAAFIRRIRHTVEFSKPTVQARERIWLSVIGALFDEPTVKSLAGDIVNLAKIEATGAQIKSAVLSSIFSIKRHKIPLSIQLLGEMLCRELSKDGRGLSERELDQILTGSRQ
ncbi:ATP-binding protein [Aliikangiella coralliicola]|uniref:ATP-binding protein n=1 Tax=Aliikangiella coralliicola TaxID=2592383 RepID=A0A545UE74_9GAMM|nr:ATP-binding protein [Aliikangiella coralliicola]TQV87769.1 ATP-binding protein [Aliikangiella coralliicola]